MTNVSGPNEVDKEAREARRARRLGSARECAFCGERDLAALLPRRRLGNLEEHHFLGRANDAARLMTLCRNCHAKASALQLNEGVTFAPPVSLLDRVISVLRAEAALLRQVADVHAEMATQLNESRKPDGHNDGGQRDRDAKP
jgi:hypothetical protein